LKPDFFPRFTVGAAMVLGVLVSGVLFVAGGTLAGWIVGKAIDLAPVRAYFTGRRKAKRSKKSAADTSTKP
jgi:hypothetical protein